MTSEKMKAFYLNDAFFYIYCSVRHKKFAKAYYYLEIRVVLNYNDKK